MYIYENGDGDGDGDGVGDGAGIAFLVPAPLRFGNKI